MDLRLAVQPVAVTKGTPLAQASEKYFANLEARGRDAKGVRTYRTGVNPFVQTCKKADFVPKPRLVSGTDGEWAIDLLVPSHKEQAFPR
jgi:hypothetical protein